MPADPIVRAPMAADGVATVDVETLPRATAKTLRVRACPAPAAPRDREPGVPVLRSAQLGQHCDMMVM